MGKIKEWLEKYRKKREEIRLKREKLRRKLTSLRRASESLSKSFGGGEFSIFEEPRRRKRKSTSIFEW